MFEGTTKGVTPSKKYIRLHRLGLVVEFILEDGKLVSDGISSDKNPTSMNFKDG